MNIVVIEDPEALFALVDPLLEAHFREVGNTAVYTLKPDYDKYRAIHAAGNLVALVAIADEECVGYSVNFLTPHVHYMDQRICYNDVLYVSPEYRNTSVAARLMRATRNEAQGKGAIIMQWHAKPDTALQKVLNKRAKLFEFVYTEDLRC